MASSEQIAQFRRMIGELTDAEPWTDAYISGLIDASATMNGAASQAWLQKAATYASMVDMGESGSTRRLSQLRTGALDMAEYYRKLAEGEAAEGEEDLTGYAYTVEIERP